MKAHRIRAGDGLNYTSVILHAFTIHDVDGCQESDTSTIDKDLTAAGFQMGDGKSNCHAHVQYD